MDRIDEMTDSEAFGDVLLEAMKRLWKDKAIIEGFNR